jgi:hypothetical protein
MNASWSGPSIPSGNMMFEGMQFPFPEHYIRNRDIAAVFIRKAMDFQ